VGKGWAGRRTLEKSFHSCEKLLQCIFNLTASAMHNNPSSRSSAK